MQNNTFITLFVGQSLVKLSKVDSTNSYLKKLLSNSKPLVEGTVIMADHQLAGRGQYSNKWESEDGKNLTFSIYLKPSFLNANHQFELNKAISLGINDCLRAIIGDDCKIKWPNDIYYQDQKMGGILIENITKGYLLKESIVGIGLNVNQIEFSKDLSRVISVSNVLGKEYDLQKLLMLICESVERRYLQLKAGKLELLEKDYLQRMFRFEDKHSYEIGNQKVAGIIKGVNPAGKLLLKTDDGLKELDLKEVAFIFD